MENSKQLNLDYVKSKLDDSYFLSPDLTEYVKNLNRLEENNNTELINIISECVRTKSLELLQNFYDELVFNDFEYSMNLEEEFNNLRQKVTTEINVVEFFDVVEFFEDNEDVIKDEIIKRDYDFGNSFEKFLNGIQHLNCFIPLGIDINEYWNTSSESNEFIELKHKIFNMFSIENNETNSENLYQMLIQGSDGKLSVWFTFNMSDFIKVNEDKTVTFKDISYIKFYDSVTLGVVNFEQGGGDSCDFKMELPKYFNYSTVSIYFDFITGYSYVHEVCGMIRDWCETKMETLIYDLNDDSHTVNIKVNNNRNINKLIENDKKYKLAFEDGKCTKGDINPNRHINRTYFNEPPYCRWECTSCGQTWLD